MMHSSSNRSEVLRIRKKFRFLSQKIMRKDSPLSTDFNHLLSYYFPDLSPVLNLQDHQSFALLSEALLSSFPRFFTSDQDSQLARMHFLLMLKWTTQNFPIILSHSDAPLAFSLSKLALNLLISHSNFFSNQSPTLQELSLATISNLIAVDALSNSKYFDLIPMSCSFLSTLSHSFSSLPSSLISEMFQFLTNVMVSGAPIPASSINPLLVSLCECYPLPSDCGIPLFLQSLSSSNSLSLLNIFALVRLCSRFLVHQSESALKALQQLLIHQQNRFLIIEQTQLSSREGVDRLLRWARLCCDPRLQFQILSFISTLLSPLLLPLILESRELNGLLQWLQSLPSKTLRDYEQVAISLLDFGKNYLSFLRFHNLQCFDGLGTLLSLLLNIGKSVSAKLNFILFWSEALLLLREREEDLSDDTDFFSLLDEALQDFLSLCEQPPSSNILDSLLSLGIDPDDYALVTCNDENSIIL